MRSIAILRLGNFSPLKYGWFMVALIASLALPADTPHLSRVQPELLTLAQEHPTQQVKVIVQHANAPQTLEALVTDLGGQITAEFPMIRAFVAQVPAQAVLPLGQMPSVHWVSFDSTVKTSQCTSCINTASLTDAALLTIGADKVWNRPPYWQGQDIGVAVVDSGITPVLMVNGASTAFNPDLHIVVNVDTTALGKTVVSNPATSLDFYGHGTQIARLIGGNGKSSNGASLGVAPNANLVNVKVANQDGYATISNVLSGLQWIFNNQAQYNIRVVNLSLNDSINESYQTSALDAAVEALWFNGIVVVASAGNTGNNKLTAPGNDPFVITVGATDDRGTVDSADDVMAPYSSSGMTVDGFAKPELVAPGTNLIRPMPFVTNLSLQHPQNVISKVGDGLKYFRMSGTSMAAPLVAGAAALLLQSNPKLTPDQVKYRLMATAKPFDIPTRAGAGYLNVDAAVLGTTVEKANQNIQVSRSLSGNNALVWNSITEGSVSWRSWGSSFWTTTSQNSDATNSVFWSSDYWDN